MPSKPMDGSEFGKEFSNDPAYISPRTTQIECQAETIDVIFLMHSSGGRLETVSESSSSDTNALIPPSMKSRPEMSVKAESNPIASHSSSVSRAVYCHDNRIILYDYYAYYLVLGSISKRSNVEKTQV